MKKLVLLFASLVLYVACDKEGDLPKEINLPPESAELVKSDNAFGLNLFKAINERENPSENVMISPLSISLALTMTYNGAESETKKAMEEAMFLSGFSRDEINALNKQLVTALLTHDPSVQLEIANSIWYRNDFQIKPEFASVNQENYDAMIQALDFSDPKTKDVINSWVAEKTHDKIEDIVDQIKAESFMFLINAIYFKGEWKYQFAPRDTREGDFYLADGTIAKADFMHGEFDVNMLQNDLFTAIELPYGKGNWSMFVMVPQYEKSLDDLLVDFKPEKWAEWQKSFHPASDVSITFPKFTFEYEKSLKEVLSAMGMERAFTSAADFSGILDGGGIQISDVKHKTFIEVNEEGTEAAAVTSVEMELTSAGNFFAANRPFVFVLAEKSTSTILFLGKFMKPE